MIKLKDIAEATGFSINTVSRALRGDSRISEASRKLISDTAEKMGYIPNVVAGSMRSNRSFTIGVISADSANPFFAEVIIGIEETARKLNYNILLINTEEQEENERDAVKLLLSRQVDGLIIMPMFKSPENRDIYRSLKIPYVFVGRRVEGVDNHSILHGDRKGQSLVIEQLLSRGHEKILYITGPDNISNTVDRKEGVYDAFRRRGLEPDPSLFLSSQGHIADGYALVNHAVNKVMNFSAVVCFNDLLAMGALKSLHENSLKVPEDVEVFGYDNLFMSQFMQPRLSTVDVPKNRLGKNAVEELVKHIDDPNLPYQNLNLEPRLVLRETTLDSEK